MSSRRAAVVTLLLTTLPTSLGAQPSPRPAAGETVTAQAAPDGATLEEAKSLFRQGNELRKAGDCERAAELFLRSRRLVASVPNTLNAAYCLAKIRRSDEALELYEGLTTFRDQLSNEQRTTIAPALGELRRNVASVDVSSNTDGTVVIDGRTRGRLPLAFPIRVLPGKHLIRVLKDGWETYEEHVTVASGQEAHVDAKLKPLTQAGRLHVDAPSLAGGLLSVDGALVGPLPWDGVLAPGAHVLAARGVDQGTAPRTVVVVAAQTVTVALGEAAPIADVRLFVEPPTAELTVGGVVVGHGVWQGWLPIGTHAVAAAELGYVSASTALEVAVGKPASATLRLVVDSSHPVWDARRVALAQRSADQRSTDEIASLYGHAAVLGIVTGAWFDMQVGAKGTREIILPPVLFAGVGAGVVAAFDNTGRPMRYGVPQGVVTGMYVGLEEGLAWTLWNQARSASEAQWSTTTATTVVGVSMLTGALGGGVLASQVGSTPGQASLVGSSALWTGAVSGLIASTAAGPANEKQDDTAFLAAAIGLNVGLAGGLVGARAASPSTARARLLDLGGIGGGLAGAGVVVLVEGDQVRTGAVTGGIAAGIVGGLGLTWVLTSSMPADRPGATPPAAMVMPTFSPVKQGGVLGLTGTFLPVGAAARRLRSGGTCDLAQPSLPCFSPVFLRPPSLSPTPVRAPARTCLGHRPPL